MDGTTPTLTDKIADIRARKSLVRFDEAFSEDERDLLVELLCVRRVQAETSSQYTLADDTLNKLVRSMKVAA